jgi:hypothetical protein
MFALETARNAFAPPPSMHRKASDVILSGASRDLPLREITPLRFPVGTRRRRIPLRSCQANSATKAATAHPVANFPEMRTYTSREANSFGIRTCKKQDRGWAFSYFAKPVAAQPPNHAETPSSTTTWLGKCHLPLRLAWATSASTTVHAASATGSFNLRLSTVDSPKRLSTGPKSRRMRTYRKMGRVGANFKSLQGRQKLAQGGSPGSRHVIGL